MFKGLQEKFLKRAVEKHGEIGGKPFYRCYDCESIVTANHIKKEGKCGKCGCKRYKDAYSLTLAEEVKYVL